MAQPGETFPQEFALGILQLAQQRKIRQAELSEMRSARAASNFLEQERLQLAERAQSLNEFQAGASREAAAAQAEVQKAAQLARITIETKKIEAQREGQVVAALGDFGRTGSAFIPSWAADKIPQLTSSSSEFGVATIQVPGLGTLVQRVSDPKLKADLAETQSKIDLNNQQIAVGKAREEHLRAQTEYEMTKAGSIVGKLGGPESVRAVTSAFEDYNERARRLASSLQFSDDEKEKARGRRITLDPSEAFKDSPADAKTYADLKSFMGSFTMALAQGMDLNKTRTDFRALEALGVGDTLVAAHNFAASQAPPETVVGRLTGPNASGQVVHKVVLSSGRTVDVDEETYKKVKLGAPVGGSAPAQQAPLQAPSPAPAPGPSDEQRRDLVEEKNRLVKVFTNPNSTKEQREAARQRLVEIREITKP